MTNLEGSPSESTSCADRVASCMCTELLPHAVHVCAYCGSKWGYSPEGKLLLVLLPQRHFGKPYDRDFMAAFDG